MCVCLLHLCLRVKVGDLLLDKLCEQLGSVLAEAVWPSGLWIRHKGRCEESLKLRWRVHPRHSSQQVINTHCSEAWNENRWTVQIIFKQIKHIHPLDLFPDMQSCLSTLTWRGLHFTGDPSSLSWLQTLAHIAVRQHSELLSYFLTWTFSYMKHLGSTNLCYAVLKPVFVLNKVSNK